MMKVVNVPPIGYVFTFFFHFLIGTTDRPTDWAARCLELNIWTCISCRNQQFFIVIAAPRPRSTHAHFCQNMNVITGGRTPYVISYIIIIYLLIQSIGHQLLGGRFSTTDAMPTREMRNEQKNPNEMREQKRIIAKRSCSLDYLQHIHQYQHGFAGLICDTSVDEQ